MAPWAFWLFALALAVFEAPTLGDLAAWIDEALQRGAGLELPPIPAGELSVDQLMQRTRAVFVQRLEDTDSLPPDDTPSTARAVPFSE